MAQWLWYWGLKMLFCCEKSTAGVPTLMVWPKVISRVGWVWKRKGHLELEFYFYCDLTARAVNPASTLDSFQLTYYPRHLWPKRVIYVLLMDTRGGGTHYDSPIRNETSFPQAGSGPRDREGLSGTPHHEGDGPHHAVVGRQGSLGPTATHPGGVWSLGSVCWKFYGKGMWAEATSPPHLHREPQRRFSTDLHQIPALGGQVKHPQWIWQGWAIQKL